MGRLHNCLDGLPVVADEGPLSPQAADLVRRIARVVSDEPGGLMAGVHAAVSAAADEPLRSEPVLAAEAAASTVTARILTGQAIMVDLILGVGRIDRRLSAGRVAGVCRA